MLSRQQNSLHVMEKAHRDKKQFVYCGEAHLPPGHLGSRSQPSGWPEFPLASY